MRLRHTLGAAALLALLSCPAVWADTKPSKAKEEASCGDHGTAVHFEASPSDAARKALKEEKLVLVLHISGHFEDPDFT